MAKNILPANVNMQLRRQFEELLMRISKENIEETDEFFSLTSPDGTKYKITVDDAGNLGTEVI